MAQRWVVVPDDPDNKTIVGGAYLWDGQAEWAPPEQGRLMLESEALTAGYSYPPPPPPDPEEPPAE